MYSNAYATQNGIFWADENGYIKVAENKYIKIAEETHYLPKLFKSTKSGKEIANDFIQNIVECWNDNIIIPLIVLGHMIMSIHFENFSKKMGVPTLIIYGETASGKTTLENAGLSFFGLTNESLTSGGSTAKSNEYFSSKYNGLCVCIDDVKGSTLVSSNFTSLVKEVYNARPRTRMLPYGKGIEYIQTCSPIVYSTNESLPELPEVMNRIHVVSIFGKIFKADKFKYYESNFDNLQELSLILPEFIKYSFDEVYKVYEDVFKKIENNCPDLQKRIINNIAYAYTGTIFLLKIANITIDNLDDNLIEYTKKQAIEYTNVKNIVDRVLTEIITLYELGVLKENDDFKIQYPCNIKENKTLVCFKKSSLIEIINKYYFYDKSKQIDRNQFERYAQKHERFVCEKTVKYNGQPVHSMCFDIEGLKEYSSFLASNENGESILKNETGFNPF